MLFAVKELEATGCVESLLQARGELYEQENDGFQYPAHSVCSVARYG